MQNSASHTANVMTAVRDRLDALNDPGFFDATPVTIEIGNPAQYHPRAEGAAPLVTLFVYRIELNEAIHSTPNTAQAVVLHTLITAFCTGGTNDQESAGSFELRILSHIVRLFLESPEIGPVRIPNALPVGPASSIIMADLMIEARPRKLEVEDLNHIWTTQADAPYRTSLAYSFSFGVITPSRPGDEGPPVITPVLEDRDDPGAQPVGATPIEGPLVPALDTPPELGVLVIQRGTVPAPNLVTDVTFTAGGGDQVLGVVGITRDAEPLTLSLEVWDATAANWVDATGRLSATAITTQSQRALQGGDPVAPTNITLSDDGNPGLLRMSATRAADPPSLEMSRVSITMELP